MLHHLSRLAALFAAFSFTTVVGTLTAASGSAPPRSASVRVAHASASASGYTLVNYPGTRVCHYHRLNIGVWAQSGTSWANRRYVANVYNPNGVRVLHKYGHAPTSHWV